MAGRGKKTTHLKKRNIPRSVIRPKEESDLQFREDRIGRYFQQNLDRFVFAELSEQYLEKTGTGQIMKGVPVPLRQEDLKQFRGGAGISPNVLAENLVWVIGCDPHFRYIAQYVSFLSRLLPRKSTESIIKKGRDAAEQKQFDTACIHFRAALCIQHDNLHAMYSYARVCRSIALEQNDPEATGRFAAESLDWLELLTETHPRFAQGYYYLGYAYLNIGLYAKAQMAWELFLSLSHNGKDKKEILHRLHQIEEPVTIEQGCNDIVTGRIERGIETLEPFLSSRFQDWWPLSYYLGCAYAHSGRVRDAIERFQYVLTKNPSHLDTMQELVSLYRKKGDMEKVQKYEKKMQLVRTGLEEEQKEMEAERTRQAKPQELRRATESGIRRMN